MQETVKIMQVFQDFWQGLQPNMALIESRRATCSQQLCFHDFDMRIGESSETG